ncbi:uncharacterized protein [Littorina saxatilis]|uniref:uncharacterized protein n=1 Tax=Littorina saxatilis TaxID=31220 RepID=UPI0038B43390
MELLCGARRVLLLVGAVLATVVKGQTPLYPRNLGFVYGNGFANATVRLDIFIDLICPDSQAALPIVVRLTDLYGPDKLQLVTHLFPLPYHRAGFYAAKGALVVDVLSQGHGTYDWFTAVFDTMAFLHNSAIHYLSDASLVLRLARLADYVLPGSGGLFQQMVDSRRAESYTRAAWKYACSRGVSEAPTFLVNDRVVAATATWTLQQWRDLLDPLMDAGASPKPH